MRTKVERYRRYWAMFERGLLSECEIVHAFVDELETDRIEADWSLLPDGYREIIISSLRSHPPDVMPQYFVIGYASEAEIARLTEVRRQNTTCLAGYLSNRQALSPGVDA
ncbi:hypothetical protein OJF2_41360 [Aquisphaera giovannonii]|uniref:Uncharacterized protein n=1 Tax=Aquisphaera giovannonii TaxID=406548 RepID=A0A5B9W4S8_9BACT|nr:hypothetical protein [Aquisphaera giovannonii]QEH35583.1 hypothetical protein OJF2_41360 [Aquisphaera giovannonii]